MENIDQNSPAVGIDRLAGQAAEQGCRWVRFSEDIVADLEIVTPLDLKKLQEEGWFPWTISGKTATVITCTPSSEMDRLCRKVLGVDHIEFVLADRDNLTRIIEHNQDINHRFSPDAGRTPLARVRTYLANRRSMLSLCRTLLAKSRTHLAVVRTGCAFIAIAIVFLRIFTKLPGNALLPFLILEVPLLSFGIYMILAHMLKYMPARKVNDLLPSCKATTPTGGSTVLQVSDEEKSPTFQRSDVVPEADTLRRDWTRLSPVMRRRFLASDRTDFAEERTTLACFRTWMANVRTWLAFVRTGGAFVGLGSGLIRAFPNSSWFYFDLSLAGIGFLMICEGLFWYFRGYHSGKISFKSVLRMNAGETIWDTFFPHRHDDSPPNRVGLPLEKGQAPGIWATTGLALERTVLADRRNTMARLRTVMARMRTGYSFIRTGRTFFFIGATFAVYFHKSNFFWYSYEAVMMLGGLLLIVDGLLWVLPASRVRKQLPYCTADVNINIPDYGIPCCDWKKIELRHDTH
ncbi:MAG: DUF202 domain-containing protein [Deltaproteobacteria bacterium]|nr:DUF202 domain-containing protein [Deltaproteobacteria bacterium]